MSDEIFGLSYVTIQMSQCHSSKLPIYIKSKYNILIGQKYDHSWLVYHFGAKEHFRFAKFTLTMLTKKAHVAYSIWAHFIEILFWLGYYLCFSWRFAIINTHKGLLKSDELVTWLYDDREINILYTQVDPDTDGDGPDTEKRE